jgi:flotillin
LQKYANLLAETNSERAAASKGKSTGRSQVENIVRGIIEGETRSIISTMTMEELFSNRQSFRDNVIKHVQTELNQFGLKIYNANVKELQDIKGSEYFANLSRKAHEGASNQAKVDVAEARMLGDIGEAERKGKTKQQIAQIEAATAVKETERKAEKAQADARLDQIEIEIAEKLELSRIKAKRAAEERDNDLQRQVELKRAAMELERQRATKVTTAQIERESAQENADASFYGQTKDAEAHFLVTQNKARAHVEMESKKAEVERLKAQFTTDAKLYAAQKEAEGSFYSHTKEAEADVLATQSKAQAHVEMESKKAEVEQLKAQFTTDARLYATEKDADANLYVAQKAALSKMENIKCNAEATKMEADAEFHAQQKRAEGLVEMAKAYHAMADALGGPQGVMQWLMLENNTYVKMAAENAKAVHGMQPKINVWNTGSDANAMDSTAAIRNLFQTLPPLLSTVQDQTGLAPPSWLAQMPDKTSKALVEKNGPKVSGKLNSNGVH